MKIITLDGIPTTGKTCLGNIIFDWLSSENKDFEVVYFNDTIRSKYGMDTLALKKDSNNRKNITIDSATEFLSDMIDKLESFEGIDAKRYLFIMDRLHYSYMDSLNATSKDFVQFENKIKDLCYYICLNLKEPTPRKLYSRIKQSLILRNDHPFTLRHFDRLVGDSVLEDEQQTKIWNHYGQKIQTYNNSFEDSALDKYRIWVDDIIHKDDYHNLLTLELKSNIVSFLNK